MVLVVSLSFLSLPAGVGPLLGGYVMAGCGTSHRPSTTTEQRLRDYVRAQAGRHIGFTQNRAGFLLICAGGVSGCHIPIRRPTTDDVSFLVRSSWSIALDACRGTCG